MIVFTVSIRFADGENREQRVLAPVVPRIGEYVECKGFCGHVDGVYHDYTNTKKTKFYAAQPEISVRLK